VIEPLGAYLLLAAKMNEQPAKFNTAYNIGPEKSDVLSVEDLTRIAVKRAGSGTVLIEENHNKPHEAATLMLNIDKIKHELDWQPVYNAQTAIEKTMDWYFDGRSATEKCTEHIYEYFQHELS
jgi:CDP-glucose 4,6-dehydratase